MEDTYQTSMEVTKEASQSVVEERYLDEKEASQKRYAAIVPTEVFAKFKLGEEIYFINNNNIISGKIGEVRTGLNVYRGRFEAEGVETKVSYSVYHISKYGGYLNDLYSVDENHLFRTRQELIDNLLKEEA